MRERILLALQQAANKIDATSAHQQQTLDFASKALLRDQAENWQLIQQPGRLRIITIDSLCQSLTQAIPLQENQTPYAQICDKPYGHYKAAARACLMFAIHQPDYQESIKKLLYHVDNRQDKLLDLFCSLLGSRDQWLQLIYQASTQDKASYEQALYLIEQHELERFQRSLPEEDAIALTRLVQRLASIEANPSSPRYPLCFLTAFEQLDAPLVSSLASALLTSQNTLRKAFDHHVGLKRGVCDDAEYEALKSASKQLLSKLELCPDFLPALLRVKNLPPPHYDPEQWSILQALFKLLPLLAAHLQLVFSEHNEVDFTAISAQALAALGDEECPTDLALYLDNTIHHLLVDEFQDTSIQQFQLLSQLVQGWQPHDGKTLFIVGDPMQSIYRFRAAEVGLFLRAKQQGIGPVMLTSLELSCNFRSSATIVDWVNCQFKSIFPKTDDIESGAVSFHSAISIKPAEPESQVIAFQYTNRVQEARALVSLVSDELKNHPSDDIAILVRSRKQLTDIIQLLRAEKIPFQGVDIDLLATLPHLRDVWSLTAALLMPANRLAWLSLLRSPWCGLTLEELHCIANFAKHQSIYFALSQLAHVEGLSDTGRVRAHYIYTVLHNALMTRHQQSLINWITDTLKQLHLEKVLQPSEQDDLEQYWLLLERFERNGQIEDMEQFNLELNKLYSQQVIPSRLQIMTIHKSKGLEFDCVILPGLSTKTPHIDTPMLRWLTLPTQQGEELLLVSPIKAAHHEECLLYDYLGKLETEKSQYELQRLLYVAVTRAKKRLYLFDNREKSIQGSFRQLLQNQVFLTDELDNASVQTQEEAVALPELFRLPEDYYHHPPPFLHQPITNTQPPVITDNTPRLIGIVAHELLQWVCDHHPETIADVPWELAYNQLKTLGFEGEEFLNAETLLVTQITRFFHNPIGQWIMKPHEQERNEYELLVDHEGKTVTRIIDRTFCEHDVRVIIDFKTGADNTSTQKKHRQQLNDYAALLSYRYTQPVRCGLYYLATDRWVDWVPSTISI